MKKSEDAKKIRPIVLAAVKAIMRAHLQDMKKHGLLFQGTIMEVDVNKDYSKLELSFSKEFEEFVVNSIEEGRLQNGLSNKTVIILDEDIGDSNGCQESKDY